MSIMSNALSIGRGMAPGPDSGFRRFGLSMRFTVTFQSVNGDINNLGEWSSCKGLKVDFHTETVKQGGEYGYEVKLPSQVVYGPVVLERAMEPASSQALQVWLGTLVANWMNYPVPGKSGAPGKPASSLPPAGAMNIVLQDVHLQPVASWNLQSAFPVSWSGPALDAKQNAVALETLTIEHRGFLPPPAATGE